MWLSRIKFRLIVFILSFILIFSIYFNFNFTCLSFIPYGISNQNYVTLGANQSFCVKTKNIIIKFITNNKGARIIANHNYINIKIFGDSQALGLEVNSYKDYFLNDQFKNNSYEIYAAPNNGPYEVINRINELSFNSDENIIINFNTSVDFYRLKEWYPQNFISLKEKHINSVHKYPFLSDIFILYNLFFKKNFTTQRNNTIEMQNIFLQEELENFNFNLKDYLNKLHLILKKKNIRATLIFSTPYWLYSDDGNFFKILNTDVLEKYNELNQIIYELTNNNQYHNIKFAKTIDPLVIQRDGFTNDNRHIKNFLLKNINYF